MIAIEIIMLIIGIAAVIASFRLSDEKETDNTKSNIDAEELEEKIKDGMKQILELSIIAGIRHGLVRMVMNHGQDIVIENYFL